MPVSSSFSPYVTVFVAGLWYRHLKPECGSSYGNPQRAHTCLLSGHTLAPAGDYTKVDTRQVGDRAPRWPVPFLGIRMQQRLLCLVVSVGTSYKCCLRALPVFTMKHSALD